MKNNFTFILAFLAGSLLLLSCVNQNDTKDASTPLQNDSSYLGGMSPVFMISKDVAKLGKVLDLQTYKPDSVVFQLSGINIDSLEKDSLTNKNFNLEAVLFYEEHVYGSILEKYMDADFPKGDYKKEDFEFEWLDELLKAELNLSKADYKGNPDIFLGTDGQARLWFSDKKIFLRWNK